MKLFNKDLLNKKFNNKKSYWIDKTEPKSKMKNQYWFMEFIKEFLEFLKMRKKYWLMPIIIVLVLFGGLIILSQGSAVAPFIYTIF